MTHLLKARGLWVCGLIAIGVSITLVSVDRRAGARIHTTLDLRADIERQFAETIEPAAVLDSAANSPAGYLTMAEIYYKQNDCTRAVVWSDKAVAAFGTANPASSEQALKIKRQCASGAR